MGNPGWNFANFLERVKRTEGLIEPTKDVGERNYINVKDWQVGRDGPVKLSWPIVVEEGESQILDVRGLLFLSPGYTELT